ncbi:class I SAM-dependent methyltransferase [Neolewinella aurantiaca]|nr:methyltransferase [Neolewinella aurantiaca]
MRKPKLLSVNHNGQSLTFPANALGGSPKEPKLKPADELLLNWAAEQCADLATEPVSVYHDREGVLCTCVGAQNKRFVSNNYLHHQRLLASYERNKTGTAPANENLLETPARGTSINLLQIPKSLELFELYLRNVALRATPETKLACAFQTRHFTPRLLEIAAKYAASVTQSRAYKKARLIMLDDFFAVTPPEISLIESEFEGIKYQQYPGVFSASHIDYATQFLLEEWSTNDHLAELSAPTQILDAGCGNGIIGDYLLGRYPEAQLTAYDVSRVATASARMNLADHGYSDRSKVVSAGALSEISEPKSFSLIVTNPPFHDEFQTDISVSTDLFLAACDRLDPGGHLVVVANRHLNYGTHLRRYFDEVLVVAENEKFEIYRCC